jgi:hypothetical protein
MHEALWLMNFVSNIFISTVGEHQRLNRDSLDSSLSMSFHCYFNSDIVHVLLVHCSVPLLTPPNVGLYLRRVTNQVVSIALFLLFA